jgi:hypothetical protein
MARLSKEWKERHKDQAQTREEIITSPYENIKYIEKAKSLVDLLHYEKAEPFVDLQKALELHQQELFKTLGIELKSHKRKSYFQIVRKITFSSHISAKTGEKLPLSGKSLMQLTDWVPSAAVRKRQKKLIADEITEINKFRAEGRIGLARWRRIWLTLHWTRYLLGAPFAAAAQLFRKTTAG